MPGVSGAAQQVQKAGVAQCGQDRMHGAQAGIAADRGAADESRGEHHTDDHDGQDEQVAAGEWLVVDGQCE